MPDKRPEAGCSCAVMRFWAFLSCVHNIHPADLKEHPEVQRGKCGLCRSLWHEPDMYLMDLD